MYAAVSRASIKHGMRDESIMELKAFEYNPVPGADAMYLYETAEPAARHYLVLVCESQEVCEKAIVLLQADARYQQLLRLLEAPLEWQGGEIVYSGEFTYSGL
jgi:hypothetical protein